MNELHLMTFQNKKNVNEAHYVKYCNEYQHENKLVNSSAQLIHLSNLFCCYIVKKPTHVEGICK